MSQIKTSPWTTEAVTTLNRLWAEGLSARKIAKCIPGTTRDSVIGRARRDGLPSRPSPIGGPAKLSQTRNAIRKRAERAWRSEQRRLGGSAQPPRTLRPPRPAPQYIRGPKPEVILAPNVIVEIPARAIIPKPSTIHKICQWIAAAPTGDDACKCGKPVEAGPYCMEHFARVWNWDRAASKPLDRLAGTP